MEESVLKYCINLWLIQKKNLLMKASDQADTVQEVLYCCILYYFIEKIPYN